MRPGYIFLAIGSSLAFVIGGCSHTPYVRPPLPLPERYPGAEPAEQADVRSDWWKAFGDPHLDKLVETVLAANPDLDLAAIRVKRQLLSARTAEIDRLPKLSGNLGANRMLNGPTGGSTQYNASLSASFEIDLWQRLANKAAMARQGAQIAKADLTAAKLSIIGLTLDSYWNIALLHEQIRMAEQDLDTAEKLRKFAAARYEAGAISGLERTQAQNETDQVRLRLSGLQQSLSEKRTELRVLLNGVQWPVENEATELSTVGLRPVPPGIPADLLWMRPDLRAAEITLQQSLRQKDYVRAGFRPDLTLTANGGTSSSNLVGLLKNPIASFAAAVSLPILNILQNDTTSRDAKLAYDAAVIEFRKKVIAALAEVDNTLTARTSLMEQEAFAKSAVDNAAQTARIYDERYRAGSVDLRELLDAQRQLRSQRANLQAKSLERLRNQSLLYRVLGGGLWEARRPATETLPRGDQRAN